MPNLTQRAYTQNLQIAYNDGRDFGKKLARQELDHDLRTNKLQALTQLMHEAAALAQANAKLTYSLHMLVEKVSRNV